MAHILLIYEGFEGAFRALVLEAEGKDEGEEGKRERKVVVIEGLKKLWIPELERAGRLRGDLDRLNGSEGLGYDTGKAEAAPKLKALTRHISEVTGKKPHLLLAYTWLLYMALFSGGRYIRARLREAGAEFWRGAEDEKGGNIDEVLSFWIFEGGGDEENVKKDFKRRFAELEGCLTVQEREDVVQEATYIMDTMLAVVEEIAEIVERENPCYKAARRSLERFNGVESDEPSMRWLVLKHILPMGMFELITGASKAVMMGIEPLYGKV